MARGGARPGGGRPKGAKNKRTLLAEEAAIGGELPKEFMLRVMRDETQQMPLRADMAKAAAPYFHSRLSSVEHTGPDGGPLQIIFDDRDKNV